MDTQGDASFFASARASDALAAAAAGQQVLAEGPVRVRMGLHTGEPTVSEEGYVGIDVHRAARIAPPGMAGRWLFRRPRTTSPARMDCVTGRLWGAIEIEEARGPVGQWETERKDYATPVLRELEPDLARGRATGRALSLDEAVELALSRA